MPNRRHPWLPTREELLASRWLAPFAKHLRDKNLWRFNRESVARAAGVGMFFGLFVPAFQTPFAVAAAIPLRANVAISAAMTFVTNPFTTPWIYYGAYLLGRWLLPDPNSVNGAQAMALLEQIKHDANQFGWWFAAKNWIGVVGPSLLLGITVLACAGAILSYFAVHVFWRERKAKAGEHHDHHDDDDHDHHDHIGNPVNEAVPTQSTEKSEASDPPK